MKASDEGAFNIKSLDRCDKFENTTNMMKYMNIINEEIFASSNRNAGDPKRYPRVASSYVTYQRSQMGHRAGTGW